MSIIIPECCKRKIIFTTLPIVKQVLKIRYYKIKFLKNGKHNKLSILILFLQNNAINNAHNSFKCFRLKTNFKLYQGIFADVNLMYVIGRYSKYSLLFVGN